MPLLPREDDWRIVPARFRHELSEYLCAGAIPESRALQSILANDLSQAMLLADPMDVGHTVLFLHNFVPARAWGSPEHIARWETLGGLECEAAH